MWVRSVGISPLSRFQLFGIARAQRTFALGRGQPMSFENVYAASSVNPRENRLLAVICSE